MGLDRRFTSEATADYLTERAGRDLDRWEEDDDESIPVGEAHHDRVVEIDGQRFALRVGVLMMGDSYGELESVDGIARLKDATTGRLISAARCEAHDDGFTEVRVAIRSALAKVLSELREDPAHRAHRQARWIAAAVGIDQPTEKRAARSL